MAKANQAFFIPESIRQLRPSNLPLSGELSRELRSLRVSTLDDLSGTSLRDFQRVSENGTVFFLEIGRLTARARGGEFAVPTFRNANLNSVVNHHRPSSKPVPKPKWRTPRTPDKAAASELPTDDTIFIPLAGLGKLLATFPVSVLAGYETLAGWIPDQTL